VKDAAGAAPRPHAVRLGAGPRPALLLHCSLAHSGAWVPLMARLGDRWTATAIDHPGHGKSPDWDGSADLNECATRMARPFLGEVPADVVGHSFGGSVALRLALEQPARVRRLVLIEPVLFAAARLDRAPVYADQAAHMAAVDALVRTDPAEALRRFLDRWGATVPVAELPAHQRRYMEARIGLIPAATPALHDDVHGLLAPGVPERLGMPVLLLEGGQSPPVIAAIGDHLARRIGRLRRVVVPGAGHMLPITHPDAVALAIAAFLDAG
jgi:pimeloyl-ACP methyl ester carboxylesterase